LVTPGAPRLGFGHLAQVRDQLLDQRVRSGGAGVIPTEAPSSQRIEAGLRSDTRHPAPAALAQPVRVRAVRRTHDENNIDDFRQFRAARWRFWVA
jgi:hypothetical protein